MDFQEVRAYFIDNFNRSDVATDQAKRFVRASLTRIARRARFPFQERLVELTVDANGTAEVPVDLLEFIAVAEPGRPALEFKSLREFRLWPAQGAKAKVYTRVGDRLQFRPGLSQGAKVELLYYADFVELVEDTDINQITAMAPDLVMLAACAEAGIAFVDDRQADFEAQFQARFAELEDQAASVSMRGGVSLEPYFET